MSRCSEGGGRGELRIDSRSSSLNVSALVGKQAVLACTVTNINNHSVGQHMPPWPAAIYHYSSNRQPSLTNWDKSSCE